MIIGILIEVFYLKIMNTNLITQAQLQLTTARLSMSFMTDIDWLAFQTLQSNEQLMQHIGPILSEEALNEKFVQRTQPWQGDEAHWITLLIHQKHSGELVGSVGFKLVSIDCQRAEIGYITLAEHQGKGFITEAAKALIEYLFEQVKVRKIVAHCAVENTGSWRVMEKLSMQREGLFKSNFHVNDTWFDEYAYGLLNPALLNPALLNLAMADSELVNPE